MVRLCFRTVVREPPLQLRLVPSIIHCNKHNCQPQTLRHHIHIVSDIPALLNQLYAPTASEVARTKTKQEAKLNLIIARHFYLLFQRFQLKFHLQVSASFLDCHSQHVESCQQNPQYRQGSSLQQQGRRGNQASTHKSIKI